MISESASLLSWSAIGHAPSSPGVYAWYARVMVGRADQEKFIGEVENAKANADDAHAVVRAYLDKFVFRPFQETAFRVSLRGPLKPKYEGDVTHQPSVSENLVQRLVDEPQRFLTVASLLAKAAPLFTAPLYIGMSIDLRARLRRHQDLINELQNSRSRDRAIELDKEGEAGFARQVVARGFDPTDLFVCVEPMSVSSNEQADLENLLNRINFPIFGRN